VKCERPAAPLWACRIAPAIQALLCARGAERDPARAELWRLLHAALYASLRAQAGRVAPVSREDLEDIASTKALELLLQAEGKLWSVEGYSPLEVTAFLARVARNGLVDLARRRGREAPPPEDADAWERAVTDAGPAESDPLERASTEEFFSAFKECVAALTPRARKVWMQRVVLDRPSREAAGALGLTVANVDVMAQRAREALTACMAAKGHRVAGLDPRMFVLLWAQSDPASWTGAETGTE
jgi:RNA polymerase sigma factor (sigma-70 family)